MIEIRETDIYHEWFESLKDKRAKARIDTRIRRVSRGGDKSTQAKDIQHAHELAQALKEE